MSLKTVSLKQGQEVVLPGGEVYTAPVSGLYQVGTAPPHIQCGICGAQKPKRLDWHLLSVHNMTVSAYRRKFKFPTRIG